MLRSNRLKKEENINAEKSLTTLHEPHLSTNEKRRFKKMGIGNKKILNNTWPKIKLLNYQD